MTTFSLSAKDPDLGSVSVTWADGALSGDRAPIEWLEQAQQERWYVPALIDEEEDHLVDLRDPRAAGAAAFEFFRGILGQEPTYEGDEPPELPQEDPNVVEELVEEYLEGDLLERHISVGGYVRRDGTVVSSYSRFAAFMQQLARPSHPTTHVTVPGGHQITVKHYDAPGRSPLSRRRFDAKEASYVVKAPDGAETELNTPQDVAKHVGLEIPEYRMTPRSEQTVAALQEKAIKAWRQKAEATVKSFDGTTWLDADTEKTYRPDGKWVPARAQLHDRVHTEILNSVTAPAQAEQQIHFMAGGPASGKSIVKLGPELAPLLPDDAVRVDADEMKSILPEYQLLTGAKRPDNASRVHEESSVMAKRLYAASVESGLHTIFDGVGGSDSFPGMVRAAMRHGRDTRHPTKVSVNYVTADLDTALERAIARGEREGRVVDEAVIRDGHRKSSAQFEAVVRTGATVRVYDTNDTQDVKLIAVAEGGTLTVMDRDLFDAFIAKKDGS